MHKIGHAVPTLLMAASLPVIPLDAALAQGQPTPGMGRSEFPASSFFTPPQSGSAGKNSDCAVFELRAGETVDGEIAVIQRITNNCSTEINYETCMTAMPWQSSRTDYYIAYNVRALPPGESDEGSVWRLPTNKRVGDHQISYCQGQYCVAASPTCRSLGSAMTFAALVEERARRPAVDRGSGRAAWWFR
jgi:hypothetical protein